MKYSPSTKGFYNPQIHKVIPEDAVEVSDAEYRGLLAGEASGKRIIATSAGTPALTSRPAPYEIDAEFGKVRIRAAVTKMLNAKAAQYHFDGIADACSYTEGMYAEQSKRFVELRDKVRTEMIAQLDKLNGKMDISVIQTMIQHMENMVKNFSLDKENKNG